MTAFGIDFGTTNSVLSASDFRGHPETVSLDEPPQEWAALGFDRVLPTVIADRGGAVEFGWRAKRNAVKLEAVKRLFASEDSVTVGSLTMKVEEAAGVFFRHIKQRAAFAGFTMDQAVVTIPANSRGVARFRTKISAGLSGIEVLALVNEPTAAAMAYGQNIADGERVLVFDWGGGTLDVTILRNIGGVFMEEASKGVQRLGGIDLDAAFFAALRAKVPAGAALDMLDLERAKVLLSEQESTVINFRGGGVLQVTRGEFEDAIRSLVIRTRDPIERCLTDLGRPKIDHLVLVGGSSKIPIVQRYIREMLRLDPMRGVDPMTAVAEGASLAAAILTGEVEHLDFYVGTEHALGTVVHDNPSQPRFSVLIPRNQKLPASEVAAYSPLYDDQESVLIKVVEGDPDRPFDHEDNVILKEWDVQLLEKRPVKDAGFTIQYKYDVDGILHVEVVDSKTQTIMMAEELTFGAATSKRDLVEIRKRIDSIHAAAGQPDPATNGWASPTPRQLSEESRAAIRKATEKIYPYVDDTTQKQFDDLINTLIHADVQEEASSREALERLVRAHAYLLN